MAISLRDGAGREAARRVRKIAERLGHLLTKFRPGKDNAPDNRFGPSFLAECKVCGVGVVMSFEPFDVDDPGAQQAISKRFGDLQQVRFVATAMFGENKCKGK